MKNKIGWLIILVEFGLLGWLTTRYSNEIRYFVNLFINAEIIETVNRSDRVNISKEIEKQIVSPTIKPTIPIKTTFPTIVINKRVPPTPDNQLWGVARQIDDVTWTMKVGEDEKMATAKEIFDALNQYRQTHGSQILNWDIKLTDYAQNRAGYLNSKKTTDKHEGFNNYVQNEDGFNKLGFTRLGENISYGYKLNGVHTIEWMYAGDKPHNDNQLDNRWNYVGVGVEGLATCLIFGTGKF